MREPSDLIQGVSVLWREDGELETQTWDLVLTLLWCGAPGRDKALFYEITDWFGLVWKDHLVHPP